MLVNCSAYEDGRKLADVPVDKISEYLRRPGCFVWVALKEPAPDEMAALMSAVRWRLLLVCCIPMPICQSPHRDCDI